MNYQKGNLIDKTTLFFYYPVLIFIYAIANGLLFDPGSVLTYIVPSLFLLYAALVNFKYNKFYFHTKLLYIFIFYLLFLVLFSSNFQYSLKNVLKSITPILFFGVAVVFVNDYRDFNRLLRSMIILATLFILNIVIANIYNLGGGKYEQTETEYLQTGSIYSEGLNSMGYFLVLVPALIQMYPFRSLFRKIMIIVMSITIFIILLLVMKRASLAVVIIGYSVMLYFAEFRQKRKLIKIGIVLLCVLAITYPLYQEILFARFKVREDRLQMTSYKTEGRFTENTIVIRDIFGSGDKVRMLFGHEVLNSPGNYGGGKYGPRQLHNDYAQLLNGSGITGLSLFLLMNYSIMIYYIRLQKRLMVLDLYKRNEKILNVIFWAFFIAYFILAWAGSIDSLVYNTIRFVFLGAIIGVFKSIPFYRINPIINSV